MISDIQKSLNEITDTIQRLEKLIEQSIQVDVETSLRQAIGQLKAARTFLKKLRDILEGKL